jgi:precorrin-6A/cobalt-precorrin-6A reductase
MILLLGGTKETASIAQSLAAAGYEVLVSTATDIPLEVGSDPNIRRRTGELKEGGMAKLIRDWGIEGIVDSTHPYAQSVRAMARKVAEQTAVPYLTLIRPSTLHEREGILWATDHEQAARLSFSFGQPVFLTIGSRNLAPYAQESRRVNIPWVVRVLSHVISFEACQSAGIPGENVLAGRGPFSVEKNRTVIRKYRIGTLVTKDSGAMGGVPEKLEAARLEGCRVIAVKRPDHGVKETFENTPDLIAAVRKRIPSSSSSPAASPLKSRFPAQ